MNWDAYYEERGDYLKEHRAYFTQKRLQDDVDFLIRVMRMKKKDRLIDLGCGHGRITLELAARGYAVTGIDRSAYLLSLVRREAEARGVKAEFKKQDIEHLRFSGAYDKTFLWFADLGTVDIDRVFRSVSRSLKRGGLFLLDADNIFRLIRYLQTHPKSSFSFDPLTLRLTRGSSSEATRSYTYGELASSMSRHGLVPIATYGSIKQEPVSIESPRLIVLAKKKD